MNMIEHKKSLIHYKELMKEWDWIENNKEGLDPNILTAGSGKKAHWCCSNGHSWKSTSNNFYSRPYCTYCRGTNLYGKRNKTYTIQND